MEPSVSGGDGSVRVCGSFEGFGFFGIVFFDEAGDVVVEICDAGILAVPKQDRASERRESWLAFSAMQ